MSIVESTAVTSSAQPWVLPIRASVGADAAVQVVETRMSWIILTSQHAYKIKKPVDFGQCRHRTLESRHRSCTDEYWLNQALAPGVYLGVLPIAREVGGVLRINGKGAVVEWAVKMRRLREQRNLLWLIQRDELTAAQVTALAESLASFYLNRPPATDGMDDLAARLQRRVADSAQQLRAVLPPSHWDAVHGIHMAQQRYVSEARTMLNARACDGRIVDGHGDLRPEHIFIERRPLVIDCAEYSASLRKLDALDDLSLLTMECELLDRPDIAATILDCYSRLTGDFGVAHLEGFYKSLHAIALAAVAATPDLEANSSAEREPWAEAVRRLGQAERYIADFD